MNALMSALAQALTAARTCLQGVLGETLARRRSLLSVGGEVPDQAQALPLVGGSALAYQVGSYFGAHVPAQGSRALRAGSAA